MYVAHTYSHRVERTPYAMSLPSTGESACTLQRPYTHTQTHGVHTTTFTNTKSFGSVAFDVSLLPAFVVFTRDYFSLCATKTVYFRSLSNFSFNHRKVWCAIETICIRCEIHINVNFLRVLIVLFDIVSDPEQYCTEFRLFIFSIYWTRNISLCVWLPSNNHLSSARKTDRKS